MTEITARLSTALADRYKIERHLGEGGMATVYLAHDLKHDRPVAVKVLRPELAAVLGAERFVQEIKTTANLQHPHILPLFDSGEADSFLYYVMPYVEGETLRDKLNRETQLGIDEAVKITTEVADALDYAHRHNVIHRDIKPENILLHDGRPMVADFGIALAVSAAAGGRMTETGLSLGTPHYMSPEQATAEKDLTNRSDIYSLGCVLYEMLTGEPPHTGASAQAIVMKIVTDEARPVTELRKSVPSHVAAATAKSLEKLAADRFGTAKEFAEGLTNPAFALARGPAAAAAGARSGGPWSRLSIGLAVVSAILLGTVLWGWLQPTTAPNPTMRAAIDFGDVQFFDVLAEVVISPDGSRLALSGRNGAENGIYVREADEADFRLLPGTEDGIYPSFSPDGESLVYSVRATQTLLKVPFAGGAPQPILQSTEGAPLAASWGDDGWITFYRTDNALLRIRETGGEPELLLSDGTVPLNARVLPGGSGVIFSDIRSRAVRHFAFGSDSSRVVVQNGLDPRYVEATGHLLWVDAAGALLAAPFDPARGAFTGEQSLLLAGLTRTAARFARYDVSENGTLVYSSSGTPTRQEELVVVHLSGATEVIDLEPRRIDEPRWSPDGRSVAYSGTLPGDRSGDTDIFIYDVELENAPRPLTNARLTVRPVWSPNGSSIVYSSADTTVGDFDLFIRKVDDDLSPRLLLNLPGVQYATDWPEEDLLVVVSRGSGSDSKWGILLVDVGDSITVREYHVPEADVGEIQVSPDGTLAAYSSNESGQNEVYIRSFPEPRAATRVSERGGRRPQWSPDGNTLYYPHHPDPANGRIVAATIQYEPTPSVLSREDVGAWPYDVTIDLHPDGDRFITVRQAETVVGGSGEVQRERTFVVTNWFAELRARTGNE